MKITRDGKEIELTREEMWTVYQAMDAQFKRGDIRERLWQYELEADDDTVDRILLRFDRMLGKSDDYYDAYWGVVDLAIKEIMGDVC